MAVYYVTISMLTGAGYVLAQKKQGSKTTLCYLAAAFLSLTFLASFRYAIGFDYFSYRDFYQRYSAIPFRDILQSNRMEPLFFVLCRLFSLTG